ELEFSAILVEGLTFYGNVGWLDIKYGEFFADLNGDGESTDNSALELVRAPKWDMRVGLDYDFSIGNMGFITLGVGLSYTSKMVLTVPNDFLFNREPLTTVDAQINWESADSKYRISLWGRNLNNDIERLGGTPVGPLFAFAAPTQPRQYGIAFTADF
ncbi:MAG: TonB-dependent receptor, partial [Alphaproteobacteria bacterium]|nr:TonB-dependent receptor [Alphaproteobacteria bacterium]